MTSPAEQALELLAAADRDRVAFRILHRDREAPVEVLLFHAQQALEKGLKAVLVAQGVVFARTHDLLNLADQLTACAIEIPVARDILARLGPYAVEFRYLGVRAPEVSPDEAADATDLVLVWARAVVGAAD